MGKTTSTRQVLLEKAFELINSSLGRLRIIAFVEGVSFLILLFIAMPLKYMWGQPNAVRSFGSLHGLLFVLYVLYVFLCKAEYGWSNRKALILLAISVVPFGNFYADKHYLREQEEA
jgi:integral membrane protein